MVYTCVRIYRSLWAYFELLVDGESRPLPRHFFAGWAELNQSRDRPAPRSALLSNSLMDDLNRQSSVSTAKPMSVATTSSGRNGADESPQPQGEVIRKALSLFTDKHSVRIL